MCVCERESEREREREAAGDLARQPRSLLYGGEDRLSIVYCIYSSTLNSTYHTLNRKAQPSPVYWIRFTGRRLVLALEREKELERETEA